MKKTEINALKVLLYDKPIGTLTYLPGDTNLFTWDEDYIEDLSRATLSLSFQDTARNLIQEIPMTRTQLPAFFSNLLPEGLLREYLAKRANINP
ncbi:MAG TPA: kinase, partial [Parachlamydiales bacterium]|nr:kinase [Parachlamydiales bacterium]